MLAGDQGGGEMNILVVDDEEAQRSLIGNLLHLKGWTVYLAENGEEALNTMAKAKIDLIISDVYMPVMDGIKLYNIVREIPGYEQLPFLFVSAYDDEHTQSTVKDPKIEGFFKKGRPVAELEGWV